MSDQKILVIAKVEKEKDNQEVELLLWRPKGLAIMHYPVGGSKAYPVGGSKAYTVGDSQS